MNCHWKPILHGLLPWAASILVVSAEPEAAPEKPEVPPFEVTATEVKMPGVVIDRKTQEARIDAKVCLDKGLLEYVVCLPNTFEHEAIFVTKAKPELVHAAMLLCGLKPTPQLRGMGEFWFEKAMKQKQSRVKIEVEWQQDGKKHRANLTSMMRNRQDIEVNAANKKNTKAQDVWIFSGSVLVTDERTKKRHYAANTSGILVGIWQNPSTVIQYGIASGDPHKGKHLGLEIDERTVPKLGTEVKLVFSRHTDPTPKADPGE